LTVKGKGTPGHSHDPAKGKGGERGGGSVEAWSNVTGGKKIENVEGKCLGKKTEKQPSSVRESG